MTTAPAHITSTAPKRIYLDLGDCAHLVDPSETFATYAAGEMTWSEDNASGCGIPYVRADLVAPTSPASGALPADAAKKLINGVREFYLGFLSRHLETDVMVEVRAEHITKLVIEVNRAELAALASPQVAPEGFKLVPIEATHEMISAMSSSKARDDEGEFPALMDLIDYSGESKTHAVLKAAYRASVAAAPAPVASTLSTMQAFEEWYCRDGNYEPEELDKWAGASCYSNADTENMWQAWQGAFASPAAPVAPTPAQPSERDKEIVDALVLRVCEYDDRTSPEDWPEALLITPDELRAEVMQAFEERDALPSEPEGEAS